MPTPTVFEIRQNVAKELLKRNPHDEMINGVDRPERVSRAIARLASFNDSQTRAIFAHARKLSRRFSDGSDHIAYYRLGLDLFLSGQNWQDQGYTVTLPTA